MARRMPVPTAAPTTVLIEPAVYSETPVVEALKALEADGNGVAIAPKVVSERVQFFHLNDTLPYGMLSLEAVRAARCD